MALISCRGCGNKVSVGAAICHHCGSAVGRAKFSTSAPQLAPSVGVRVKYELAGAGCVIQAIGLIAPVVGLAIGGIIGGIIGAVVMLIFFAAGSLASKRLRCGGCGNPVADRDVRTCPTCKARL